jgi:hypothetical protein
MEWFGRTTSIAGVQIPNWGIVLGAAVISPRLNSHSPKTNLGNWMRSARFPLNIRGGCCHSREPTVWSQLIAGSAYARRKSRADPANLYF